MRDKFRNETEATRWLYRVGGSLTCDDLSPWYRVKLPAPCAGREFGGWSALTAIQSAFDSWKQHAPKYHGCTYSYSAVTSKTGARETSLLAASTKEVDRLGAALNDAVAKIAELESTIIGLHTRIQFVIERGHDAPQWVLESLKGIKRSTYRQI